jgi:flagellar FliL protein
MADDKPDEKPEEKPEEKAAEESAEKPSGKKGKKAAKGKSKGGSKKLLIIAIAVIVVILGGGAAAFFMLSGDGKKEAKVNLPPPPGEMTMYAMPKFLSDLKTGKCRANYIKMRISVEVGKNYTKLLQTKQPKIMEALQLQMRSYERQDLIGREGDKRVRADLITIINRHIKPGKIEGILFKEFLLQ